MTEQRQPVIGVLGMPDNENTRRLIAGLAGRGVEVDFVVYWAPSKKEQYKRVVRKLRLDGLAPTLQRIYYALRKAKAAEPASPGRSFRRYFVPSHNSGECVRILQDENVDLLILATDAIIASRVLRVPKLATLNAHPGWAPRFRGLGATWFQLEAGRLPAVTVHRVDEGVDTGLVILRECIKLEAGDDLDTIEVKLADLQVELLARAIRMFERGPVAYIDTFEEPSSMTRGMPLVRRRALARRLASGQLRLEGFD